MYALHAKPPDRRPRHNTQKRARREIDHERVNGCLHRRIVRCTAFLPEAKLAEETMLAHVRGARFLDALDETPVPVVVSLRKAIFLAG